VTSLDLSGPVWFAATSRGVFSSIDQGASWQGGPVLDHSDFVRVASSGEIAYAASHGFLASTKDGGKSWQQAAMPSDVSVLRFLVAAPNGSLWIGSRDGVFYSEDQAQSWKKLASLPFNDVDGLNFDRELNRLMVTSASGTLLMAIDPVKKDWKWWDIGWNVHTVRSAGGRLVAASLFDGVVLQPKPSGTELAAGSK
jgi:ligand-binding sensor domain-containing protein